jgi:hypothetical protein
MSRTFRIAMSHTILFLLNWQHPASPVHSTDLRYLSLLANMDCKFLFMTYPVLIFMLHKTLPIQEK